MSCRACVPVTWAPELDELGDVEPQAAITVVATIAAAAMERLEGLNMTQVVSGCRLHQRNRPGSEGWR